MSFKFPGGSGWSLVREFKNSYLLSAENLSRRCPSLRGWTEIERAIITATSKFLLLTARYPVENIEFAAARKPVYFSHGIL